MNAPPYPSDTRAKGWRFEIDMEKVKASDTWLRAKRGDVRGALLLLWSEAWQQTPCGSLPNDDELIALLLDMTPATFAKHRSVLMRGWVAADDGRLYHETITARVLAMLEKRAKDARRTADKRARISDAPVAHDGVTAVSRVTPIGPAPEFDTKHQAPVVIEEAKASSHPERRSGVHRFPPGFDEFWAAYPRKVGKDAAAKAFAKRRVGVGLLAQMLAALSTQKTGEQWRKDGGQFIPHPATWLNEGRWQDETPGVATVDAVFGAAL